MNKILLILILISIQSLAQDKINSENANSHPVFNIHAGYGFALGGRLGIRVIPSKEYSFEAGYGLGWENFIGLSDAKIKYSAGVNYHFNEDSKALSLLIIYEYKPHLDYKPKILISPNFGWIFNDKTGIAGFARAGFSFCVYNKYENKPTLIDDFSINIDLGIGFNF